MSRKTGVAKVLLEPLGYQVYHAAPCGADHLCFSQEQGIDIFLKLLVSERRFHGEAYLDEGSVVRLADTMAGANGRLAVPRMSMMRGSRTLPISRRTRKARQQNLWASTGQ